VVLGQFKFNLGNLFRAAPGARFQTYYAAHAETRRARWTVPVLLTLGLTFVAMGLIALVTPGPGVLLLLLGAGLLSRESLLVARFLDSLELRIRCGIRETRSRWRKSSVSVRLLASLSGLVLLAMLAFGSIALILGL
jgi:hypothetical protein